MTPTTREAALRLCEAVERLNAPESWDGFRPHPHPMGDVFNRARALRAALAAEPETPALAPDGSSLGITEEELARRSARVRAGDYLTHEEAMRPVDADLAAPTPERERLAADRLDTTARYLMSPGSRLSDLSQEDCRAVGADIAHAARLLRAPHDMVACGRAFAESYLSAEEKRTPTDEAVAREMTADYWPWSRAEVVDHVRAAVKAAHERARKGEG
jgi:hypothetical protein